MVGELELFNRTIRALKAAGIEDRIEAATLFELATGRRRGELRSPSAVSSETAAELEELVRRRVQGEPLQYICGSWPFLDFELRCGPGVLIPRPETELLAQTAINFLKEREGPAALDLCSGTGCVAISIARKTCVKTTALEYSEQALGYLRKNVKALAAEVEIVKGDVFNYNNSLKAASLDCITCNPPYLTPSEYEDCAELKYEPREALVGGKDGLDFYRHIIPAYKRALKAGGLLALEIGYQQSQQVEALMQERGYNDVKTLKDIFNNPRVVSGFA
ncbi:MAG: peptide chain release factor N(5)-glutamine methyltransferase [Oscillospiraceae bacterium]|nr:peptide chain release factor N(5)-glutamine methyltransferase [Oscillospiraceae bacterium]